MRTTREQGDARLLILADFLDTLPQGALKMDAWVCVSPSDDEGEDDGDIKAADLKFAIGEGLIGENPSGSYEIVEGTTPAKMADCGFAACAVGWAGSHKPLRDQGFYISIEVDDSIAYALPRFGIDSGPWAVQEFFGLSEGFVPASLGLVEREWSYLFGHDAYEGSSPAPQEVAARIRAYIANPDREPLTNDREG